MLHHALTQTYSTVCCVCAWLNARACNARTTSLVSRCHTNNRSSGSEGDAGTCSGDYGNGISIILYTMYMYMLFASVSLQSVGMLLVECLACKLHTKITQRAGKESVPFCGVANSISAVRFLARMPLSAFAGRKCAALFYYLFISGYHLSFAVLPHGVDVSFHVHFGELSLSRN